jgi:hypothetical protein
MYIWAIGHDFELHARDLGHVPGHRFSPHLAVENLKLALIISKHVDSTI